MSLKSILKKMRILEKTKRLETAIATTMLAVTADRIFTQGKDASGNDIGTYSPGYIKQRRKNNYPSSSKVILQATRQMANDWSVIGTDNGVGLGFKNAENANKSEYVEDTYNKDIFKHTKDELTLLDKVKDKEVKKILNG